MKALDLTERRFGEKRAGGAPVVLLHGLLGSSRNWQTAAVRLAERHAVVALDLRNHGDSPHDRRMDYGSMAADVRAWADREGSDRIHLVGHSMGGKVAMRLACDDPGRVASLTVVDIAPRAYPPRWEREFAAMRRMPVSGLERRSEAEAWLEEDIRDWAFRKFLVSNLERDPGGGFRWRVNLEILEGALPELFRQVPEGGEGYAGPTLFMRGAGSRFVSENDRPMMARFFPDYRLETVEGAGHNVHFDQPDRFAAGVLEQVERADG
jgi:pimeloyl-ACP methyl ester carboxylesterase